MDILAWTFKEPKDVDPIALSNRGANVYRKQIIYTGTFTKHGKSFKVDKRLLRHWAETGNLFLSKGIGVPMPNTHDDTADDKRADVVQFELGKDSKGRDSLFVHFEFVQGLSADVQASLKGSDVSIFSPPEYEVSGNTYKWPVKHVAFTSYPVVPDLDKSHPIAASLEEKTKMDLKEFAKLLGLELDDATIADAGLLRTALTTHFASFKEGKIDLPIMQPIPDPTAPTPLPTPAPVLQPPAPAPAPVDPVAPVPASAPMAASNAIVKLTAENRRFRLNELLTQRRITPAQAKELSDVYCQPDKMAIAFSTQSGSFTDGFEAVCTALSKNEPLALSEQSPSQVPPTDSKGRKTMMDVVNRKRKAQGLEPV